MYRFLFIGCLVLCLLGTANAPPRPPAKGIVTDHNYSTEQLVRDVFLKSECINVFNIKKIGKDVSVGHFAGANNIFGFDEGVLISSGDIKLAEGPNDSVESSATFADDSNDPDIKKLASDFAFDVAGIEFDFIPVGEVATFRYVFASEEYCEFVGSVFNDVFGFFVSGPGINGPFSNGAANVALLPGTDQYVAINTVNFEENASSYRKNELPEDANRCGIPFSAPNLEQIEYDGFTIPLTATFNVIPCETYHIRLLVSDVGDDKLDSGVFLEAKSFNIGSNLSIRAEAIGSQEPIAIEGCRNGRFVFSRPESGIDESLTIDYVINQNSTAESGLDYEPISGTVVMPAGQIFAFVPIQVIDDQLTEDPESLRIELVFPCDCLDPLGATLILQDLEPIKVSDSEIKVCAGQEFIVAPSIVSGASPYTYQWQNGSTDPSITATIDQQTEFFVTVTDNCNTAAAAVITADLQPVPSATLSGETRICKDGEGALMIVFEGRPPWTVQYSIDGGAGIQITNITQTPYNLKVSTPGLYELTAFRDANCNGTTLGSGRVTLVGPEIEIRPTGPSCFNSPDGEILLSIRKGQPPYQIVWEPAVNDDLNPTGLKKGDYAVSVTDASGCLTAETINLAPSETRKGDCQDFDLYVPNAFSPNGDGFNDLLHIFPESDSNLRRIKSFRLFDRWGALIYQKNNFLPLPDIPLWDGTFNGRPMQPGVFVWLLIAELHDGSEKVLSGDVLLFR
ncbi:MAG: choice-of-anchor L domain-containing protein [Lewinella sp.]|nr:choice-of-anchor L domain-containing protein [Lewinella sp.]